MRRLMPVALTSFTILGVAATTTSAASQCAATTACTEPIVSEASPASAASNILRG